MWSNIIQIHLVILFLKLHHRMYAKVYGAGPRIEVLSHLTTLIQHSALVLLWIYIDVLNELGLCDNGHMCSMMRHRKCSRFQSCVSSNSQFLFIFDIFLTCSYLVHLWAYIGYSKGARVSHGPLLKVTAFWKILRTCIVNDWHY